MVGSSVVIHTIQALLSPISVWATVIEGIIAGAFILALIGSLAIIDVAIRNLNKKNRVMVPDYYFLRHVFFR